MDTFALPSGGILFDAVALTAVATFLLSLIKPFVETLPFARTTSPTHDATLRLLNVLLNIALAMLAALVAGQLTGATWLPLILQGLAQAAGAHTLYQTTTRSGGSVGGQGTAGSSAPVQPLVDVAPASRPSAPSMPVVTAAQVAAATFTARDAGPNVLGGTPDTTQAGA